MKRNLVNFVNPGLVIGITSSAAFHMGQKGFSIWHVAIVATCALVVSDLINLVAKAEVRS